MICLQEPEHCADMFIARSPTRARDSTILVALHDVEPATFDRCALIRDWLGDHGVERVTLLVIPARDLHPLHDRRPEIAEWLQECQHRGDAIAQHGFQHLQLRRAAWPRQTLTRIAHADEAEFVGLDEEETRRAVEAGWRVLKLAGVEPRGFVAPAYAYTQSLRDALTSRFDWWAELLRVRRGLPARSTAQTLLSPPIKLAAGGTVHRLLSPGLLRVGALAARSTLRVDVHPGDLDHTHHMLALERVLQGSRRRTAVTYDDLVG
jgi:predicted deacetylase